MVQESCYMDLWANHNWLKLYLLFNVTTFSLHSCISLAVMTQQYIYYLFFANSYWSPNSLRAEHQGPLPYAQFQSFYSMLVAKSANKISWEPAQVSDFTLKSWKQFAEEAFKCQQWIAITSRSQEKTTV